MKKIVGLILGLLCYLLVPVKSYAVTNEEACVLVALFAEGTMIQRQKGVPLEDMLETARTRKKKSMEDLLREMAQEAYRVPIFATKAKKKQAVSEFKAQYQRRCLRSLEGRR